LKEERTALILVAKWLIVWPFSTASISRSIKTQTFSGVRASAQLSALSMADPAPMRKGLRHRSIERLSSFMALMLADRHSHKYACRMNGNIASL
jgi:hypothetical protein